MYDCCKVHKKSVDGCPYFRPILHALQTPTYNLAKYVVSTLKVFSKLMTNTQSKIQATS